MEIIVQANRFETALPQLRIGYSNLVYPLMEEFTNLQCDMQKSHHSLAYFK